MKHNKRDIFLFFICFCLTMQLVDAQPKFSQKMPIPVNSHRGQRILSDDLAETQQRQLSIEKKLIKQTEDSLIIIITFNIPINPNSIAPSTIKINDVPLDSSVLIKFNRVGNEVHIFIPLSKIIEIDIDNTKELVVLIEKINAYAYDGIKSDDRSIENLEFGVTYQ
mgnify:CR=1 FL=1